jgi:pimeloyl-ACP methyl ester carboxylesterase
MKENAVTPFESRGSGPVVTFLHGFALDGRMWRAQVGALEATHRTVTVDLPGFGPQGAPATGVHCPAEAVLEVHDAAGVERTHLVGHSFGGAVAVDFALAHPERLLSLTMVDALLLGRASGIAGWARCVELSQRGQYEQARRVWVEDPLFAAARTNPKATSALEEMARDYACGHWAGRVTTRWLFADPASRLGEIRAPTTVVDGELDTPNFRAMAAEYVERLPHARRVTLHGAGHMCNLESPEAFNEAMREVVV